MRITEEKNPIYKFLNSIHTDFAGNKIAHPSWFDCVLLRHPPIEMK